MKERPKPKTIGEMREELREYKKRTGTGISESGIEVPTEEDVALMIQSVLDSQGASASDVLGNDNLRREIVVQVMESLGVTLSGEDLRSYLQGIIEGRWRRKKAA